MPLLSCIIKEDKSHISEFSVPTGSKTLIRTFWVKGFSVCQTSTFCTQKHWPPRCQFPPELTSMCLSFYKCPFPPSSHSLLIRTATLPWFSLGWASRTFSCQKLYEQDLRLSQQVHCKFQELWPLRGHSPARFLSQKKKKKKKAERKHGMWRRQAVERGKANQSHQLSHATSWSYAQGCISFTPGTCVTNGKWGVGVSE